jgi:hypothetical protein
MSDKKLIKVALTELSTVDDEVIGSLYPHKGKVYRWVKNSGSTSLTQNAVCLVVITSVTENMFKRVIAPSGAGTTTGLVGVPAGMPVTGIGPSGSATGDHGWIQVKGPASIKQQQLTTALVAGSLSIASSTYDSAWASNVFPSADSANMSYVRAYGTRRVELLQPVATTGAATAANVVADIQCL